MKKIYIPNQTNNNFGGGTTFLTNFLERTGHTIVESVEDCDVYFIANPMRVERDELSFAAASGKKIITRLDNIPEDFNNRGTAISRLSFIIVKSDELIYQSEWAKKIYERFIKSNIGTISAKEHIIHNGVDTEKYHPGLKLGDDITFLFVKSSRNENKRYLEALELFREISHKHPNCRLLLCGIFADDMHKYNYGFYNGEKVQYLGPISYENMPDIYALADYLLFPAYADCAPNVVLEAMSAGVVPVIHKYGGAFEFTHFGSYCIDVNALYSFGATDLLAALQKINSDDMRRHIISEFHIDKMVDKYDGVING